MEPALSFIATDADEVDHLLDGLIARTGLVDEGAERIERVFHDSFDWRLWSAGSVVELRRTDRPRTGPTVRWHTLDDASVLGQFDLRAVPALVDDLPPGATADRLRDLLDMRALLALVRVTSVRRTLARVDGEGKRRARLVVERSHLLDGTPLPPRLDVVPVRGYQRDAAKLADLLAAQVGLAPTDTPLVEAAYRAVGLTPGGYSSKLKIRFPKKVTALDAWRLVLADFAATMALNLPGVIDDTDSEFLHDYRVAVRRTRSILTAGKGVLHPDVLDRFRPEFAWLGAVTTPVRDLDVWLLDLPHLVAELDPAHRDDLAPLADLLRRRQRRAHTEQVAALTGERALELTDTWAAALATADALAGPDAALHAADASASRIWRTYRRLVKDGRAIGPDSPAEALHELRKDGKKLRYLLECFGPLFPADQVGPVIKELKGLQDVLGTFQDTEVQAQSLRAFGQELLDASSASADTLIAMGHLVDRITARQHEARSHFAERFERFDAKENRVRIRALFSPDARAEASS
jgi:CHAD domain-containing protein